MDKKNRSVHYYIYTIFYSVSDMTIHNTNYGFIPKPE